MRNSDKKATPIRFVQRHENHWMVGGDRRIDKPRHFPLTQNLRQSFGTFRIVQIDLAIRPAKHFEEKEEQCRGPRNNGTDGERYRRQTEASKILADEILGRDRRRRHRSARIVDQPNNVWQRVARVAMV